MGVVLVTGGAGVMGGRLALALAARGDRTRVLCLPGDPAAPVLEARGLAITYGDVTRRETLVPALLGVKTVFHLAAVVLSPDRPEVFRRVNVDGTRNLLETAEAAGASHFIFVSSVSVLYPWSNAYALSKRSGEELVKRARLPHYTIVRPSLAYEDGGSAEFMQFVEHLRRHPVVLLPGGGRARKNPVHVEDLVQGFMALPGNPAAYGKTYHFAGGEVLTLRSLAETLLTHMGRPKPILGVPVWACRLALPVVSLWARLTGRPNPFTRQTLTGLIQDAVPDRGEAGRDLGYNPRPFSQGVSSLASLRRLSAP